MAASRLFADDPGPCPRHAACGRADLLRVLAAAGPQARDWLAAQLGYEALRPEPAPRDDVPPSAPSRPPVPTDAGRPGDPLPPREPLRAWLYAVVDRQELRPADPSTAPTAEDAADAAPPDDVPALTAADLQSAGQPGPEPQPLVPDRRLARFLRRCLRRPGPSQRLDVGRWVQAVAQGRTPRRLPTQRLPGWHHGSALVIDGSAAAQVVSHDLHHLLHLAWRGSAGQVALYWCDAQGDWWQLRQPNGSGGGRGSGSAGLPWQPSSARQARRHRHWLLVSPGGAATRPWAGLGLAAAALAGGGSAQALVLNPHVPRSDPGSDPGSGPSHWPFGLRLCTWDHGASLLPRRPAAAGEADEAASSGVPILLQALSLAVRVEPALLRAVRLALGLPVAVEVDFWRHEDVQTSPLAAQIQPLRMAHYRSEAARHLPLAQRQRVARLVAEQHRHASPLIRHEEAVLAADLAPGAWSAEQAQATQRFWQGTARLLRDAPTSEAAQSLSRYVGRTEGRAHAGLWAADTGLAETWVRAMRERVQAGAALPAGLPASVVRQVLDDSADHGPFESRSLVQRGQTLCAPNGAHWFYMDTTTRFTLGELRQVPRGAGLVVQAAGLSRYVPLPDGRPTPLLQLNGPGPWVIESPRERLTVAAVDPSLAQADRWALEWGRDRHGLYALAPSPWGEPAKLYRLDEPDADGECFRPVSGDPEQAAPGCSMRVGADARYGLWAEIVVGPAVQRLRWIEPGRFRMGSPDSEPERFDNEGPQHEVTLTAGFWLADTACTQLLWEAVTSDNPSHFRDSRRSLGTVHPNSPLGAADLPVEQVSWNDVQGFLMSLKRVLPRCVPGLPTEAQWEYACRAGTQTPFSFGLQITTGHVNYRGDAPYAGGAWGFDRNRTVEVKRLPPNDWGLYEMHGNVLEWCADGLRTYTDQAQVDPMGARDDEAPSRVMRGGSWSGGARGARSAYRDAFAASMSSSYLGFRLMLAGPRRANAGDEAGWARPGPGAGQHA